MPVKSSPPHIRSESSVPQMMWTVALALLPALLASFILSRFPAFRITTVAVLSAVLAEMGMRKLFGRQANLYDGSAVVTALLLALLLPSSLPSWMVAAASFFAIAVGREIFGGLGQYPFHPALLGAAFILACFPSTENFFASSFEPTESAVYGLSIFAGGMILLLKRLISWESPLLYLGSLFVFSSALGAFGGEILLSGSVLLAAFFLVTDPVTTPLTRRGVRWFAVGAGVLTVAFREWLTSTEGVIYGVLLMNSLNPWFDRWFRR